MKKVTMMIFLCILAFDGIAQKIVVNSDIISNTTWNSAALDTVLITSDIKVVTGKSLTIIGGLAVIFDPLTTLTVEGTLTASGSKGDTIRFGVSDTTGFPDFRNNAFGGWGGIRSKNGKMFFDYCEFSFAKYANPADTNYSGELNMLSAYRSGGAIYGTNSTLSLTNSVIRNCFAYGGSALQCDFGCSAAISHCRFTNNESWHLGTVSLLRSGTKRTNISSCDFVNNNTLGGGGLYFYLGDSLFVDGCRFYNNKANRLYWFQADIGGGENGAAIYLNGNDFSDNLDISISRCEMMYGNADNNGGAIYSMGNVEADIYDNLIAHNTATQNSGGGLYLNTNENFNTTNFNIIRNVIRNNKANFGGGINYYNTAIAVYKLNIINNLIVNNLSTYNSPALSGGGGGGGIRIRSGNDSVLILHNTIVNNFSNFMAGGICLLFPKGNTILSGNLIWGNQTTNVSHASKQIGFYGDTATATLETFKNNLIQNGIDSIAIMDYLTCKYYKSTTYQGTFRNNISMAPELVAPTTTTSYTDDALAADFELQSWSPALNKGETTVNSTLPYMNIDLALNPRIYNGAVPVIDLGCYEFQGESTNVSVSGGDRASGLELFPNPVTDFLNVKSYAEEIYSCSILDLSGRLVISVNPNQRSCQTYTINVSSLRSGVYFIKLITENKQITRKIIIR